MDRGWGLTLENSDKVGFFGNKQGLGFDSSPNLGRGLINMFPVSSNGREDHSAVSLAVSGEPRAVLGEVDFFAEKKNTVVKKESSQGRGDARDFEVNNGLQLVMANTGSDQSTVDDGLSSDAEADRRARNELAQLQIELERMNAENQRLKGMLTQVSSNYSALQMHFLALQQQQSSKTNSTQEHEMVDRKPAEDRKQEIYDGVPIVPRQFLELGPSGAANPTADQQSNSLSEERTLSGSPRNNLELSKNKRTGREDSPESESWAPNKAPKLNPAKPLDQSADATMRKARVSVRARSEAPMISDGCQWRKYGQKMAKGNPCPRAYYRCTMATGCPVRKQVQRCADDRTILITTYEGTHNHPLPPAAMAMVSTTSAAANMLLSGSMPSADGMMNPNFLARTILPCSSNMATISASAPFPTITLDLTQTPNPLQFQRPSPAQFQAPFPVPHQNLIPIPNQSTNPSPPPPPHVFGQALYNQSKFSGLQLSQDVVNESAERSSSQNPPQAHPLFADTLSALTADPKFTAAVAAAISSIIGCGSQPNSNNQVSNSNNNPNVNTSK